LTYTCTLTCGSASTMRRNAEATWSVFFMAQNKPRTAPLQCQHTRHLASSPHAMSARSSGAPSTLTMWSDGEVVEEVRGAVETSITCDTDRACTSHRSPPGVTTTTMTPRKQKIRGPVGQQGIGVVCLWRTWLWGRPTSPKKESCPR
jgi:hypothetical protein